MAALAGCRHPHPRAARSLDPCLSHGASASLQTQAALPSAGPGFAYSELCGHNLSAGEQQRRKQLQTLVRKYFCPKVGQEYKSAPLSLSLLGSVRLHLQLLHIQLRLRHSPKIPQPLPKEPRWEIPFLGMPCHLVPSWEISSWGCKSTSTLFGRP